MTAKLRLSARDQLLLRALSLQVRLFSQRQLAEAFWNGDIANTRRRLRRLDQVGLIERKRTLTRPLPEMLAPVTQWQPGEPEPDAGATAFQLQRRWRFQSLRSTVIVVPTQRTIDHFGGRANASITAQLSHDLGVAAIWLWFQVHQPNQAQCWRGENWLDDTGSAKPDAVLLDEQEQPTQWIEFGGDYSAERIAALHDAAAQQRLPYQIW